MSPPMSSSSRRVMASPSPVPSTATFCFISILSNLPKSFPISSSFMPMPVSLTTNVRSNIFPVSYPSLLPAETDSETEPCFVYFTALFRTFVNICLTRISSPYRPSGSISSTSTLYSIPFSRALNIIILLTSFNTELSS